MLPAERIVRAGLALADARFALFTAQRDAFGGAGDGYGAGDGGGARITALSCPAARRGLEVGMTLVDARAASPGLLTLAQNAAADRTLLEELVQLAGRWHAQAIADKAGDLPDDFHGTRRWGLVLDLTGIAQGEEASMLQQIISAIRALGLTVASALAGTPDAARALARFSCDGVRALPLAALGLSDDGQIALRRAGLRRIGELADLPRAGLAARFGPDLARRLGRLLGEEIVSSAVPAAAGASAHWRFQ